MSENFTQHKNLAIERFDTAEELFLEEKYQTAAHLFINAIINYHNALCQKFLHKIPQHKPHFDTSYFNELAKVLGKEINIYRDAYEFLISYKSQADYGTSISINIAQQIRRKAYKIKEIIEPLL